MITTIAIRGNFVCACAATYFYKDYKPTECNVEENAEINEMKDKEIKNVRNLLLPCVDLRIGVFTLRF